MPITTFLDPAQMPQRTQDQETFDARLGAVMQKLPTFGAEVNATAAEINAALTSANASIGTTLTAASSLAAGGGSLSYTFDTATADADPTAGKFRLNNATQNLATVIRFDLTGSDALDYTSLLDTFDASTSVVKGTLTLRSKADPRKFLAFNLTARAAPAGYRNFTVVCTGSSSANPFANGDAIAVQFVRAGDIGPQGSSYTILRVRDEKASGTNGGTSVVGVQTRTLNTVKTNTIAGASVSGNQVTLPAGTYEVLGTAPARQPGGHQAYLFCVTDASIVILGTSDFQTTAAATIGRSIISGEFTIASTKVYEVRHYIASAQGSGLGEVSGSGNVEVYTEISFKKLA